MPHSPDKTDHPASKAWYWIDNYYDKRQQYFEDSGYTKRLPDSDRDLKSYLNNMKKFIGEFEERGKKQGMDHIAFLPDLKKTIEEHEDKHHRGTLKHHDFDELKTLWHVTCEFAGLMDGKPHFGGVI